MAILKLFLLSVLVFETQEADWDYDASGSHGPSTWGGDCQTGSSQSPININMDNTLDRDLTLGEFTFTNYDQANKYTVLKNNGHAIQVDMSTTDVTISGGGLVNSGYQLAQFHFHWGTTSMYGSEHTIDNTYSPLEVHFVHFNKIHGDIGTAVNLTNGLAVLGFMFEVQSSDNTNLDFLFNQLTNVANKDQTHNLPSSPAIDTMLGNVNRTKFVRYSGSLTTPACYESVQWTVFTEKIPISEAQLAKIRVMKSDTSGTTAIGKNYRPVQSINTRTIKISYDLDVSTHSAWDYDTSGSHGPSTWGGDCQTGSSQSPININMDNTLNTDLTLGEFTFTNYDQANKYTVLKNNGHAIQVDMSATDVTISGGGLVNSGYQLAQFHFHWGTTSMYGSEHTIDNKYSPLEVHFVHFNKIHGDIGTAVNLTNGLAVLGFMFEVQSSDNTNLDFLIDQLTNVANKDQTHNLPSSPAIDTMLGNVNRTKFVRYSGSLTTPACYESVQWTVFTEKIPISEAQLNKIRVMKKDTSGTTAIGKNYRPVQSINTRKIKISYDQDVSAATSVYQNITLLLLTVVIAIYM